MQYVESSLSSALSVPDSAMRPSHLNDFHGQEDIKKRLDTILKAAQGRDEALGHCLFSGPPGLGKTTLAHIIGKTLGVNVVTTTGPAIEIPGDLAGILTSLKANDILFIDEIHRLNKAVEEYLYPAIEDFKLDLVIDKGPCSRIVQTKLPRFTLIGATTKVGSISSPLRSRFPYHFRLSYYSTEELINILARSTNELHFDLCKNSLSEIARRSRGTPRIANNLLKWVRDYLQIHTDVNSPEEVIKSLEMMKISSEGLEEIDKKILELLILHHDGGPVGLSTIAVGVGEDKATIEEVYEPFLIQSGYIKRTPRGRVVTEKAINYFNLISEE